MKSEKSILPRMGDTEGDLPIYRRVALRQVLGPARGGAR